MSELTISQLVAMAYGTAKANGFHDRDHEPVMSESAHGQIAAMILPIIAWAQVVEAIRKPEKANYTKPFSDLLGMLTEIETNGSAEAARVMLADLKVESWQLRLLSWLGLMVTELAEAMEAVIKKDKDNFEEELDDCLIRKGDLVGAINDDPNHPFHGIDLEAGAIRKNERNQQRGYRHGGKRA